MTDAGAQQPVVTCPDCGAAGPPGSYCASCGTEFGRARSIGLGGMRGYPAAPDERVLSPRVVTSLFPRLSTHARRPFRIALLAVLLALVVFAVLRWQAPVVAVAVLGFAVLFAVYLAESDVFHDFPRRFLVLTAIAGAAIGAAWGAVVGQMVSRSYDVPLGQGMQAEHVLPQGMALAAAGGLLMLVPAVIVAMLRPPLRESLDGYVIGALGAVCFTVAATVVRLAPQLAAGPTTDQRSVAALLVEAGIQGVAVPLMAAGAGGLFGIALWFRSRLGGGVEVWAVVAAGAVAMVLYAAKRLIDLLVVGQLMQLLVHLLIAMLALLAARIGVRTALLHEALDTGDPAESFACPDCATVTPGARFCVTCGVALHAFSRSARNAGHPTAGHATRRRLMVAVGAGVGVTAVVALGVSALMTPPTAHYVCPPDCGAPPMGTPVMTNPQFTSDGGDFTVSYPGGRSAYRPTFNPNGVVLDFTGGDTGTLELHGEAANGRTPQRVADDLLRRSYPDAMVVYQIPNASVGYQPGYGVVADDYPQDGMGTYTRLRILLMVAIKNDYALVASAAGPYHEFSPSFGNGHPSGANLQLALDMAKYVNSFVWRGDSPR